MMLSIYHKTLIFHCYNNDGSPTRETSLKVAVNMEDLTCVLETFRTLKVPSLFTLPIGQLEMILRFESKHIVTWEWFAVSGQAKVLGVACAPLFSSGGGGVYVCAGHRGMYFL